MKTNHTVIIGSVWHANEASMSYDISNMEFCERSRCMKSFLLLRFNHFHVSSLYLCGCARRLAVSPIWESLSRLLLGQDWFLSYLWLTCLGYSGLFFFVRRPEQHFLSLALGFSQCLLPASFRFRIQNPRVLSWSLGPFLWVSAWPGRVRSCPCPPDPGPSPGSSPCSASCGSPC